MRAPEQLMPEGGQELERLLEVGSQGRLAFDPRLRVRKRLEDATSTPDGTLDDTSVDQDQQNDRSLMQRHRRPVLGACQIVLEVQARVADSFLEQRDTMLVVAVQTVVGEAALPTVGHIISN
jgi:hypothetical protein